MDRQNRWSVLRDVHLHGRLNVVRSSVTSTNSSTADAGGRSRSASHQSRPSFGSNRSIVGGKPKLNSFRFREGRARLERLESDPQDRDQDYSSAARVGNISEDSSHRMSAVPSPLIKRITIRTAQMSTSKWPSRPVGRALLDCPSRNRNMRPGTAESFLPEAITCGWMRHHHHLSTGSSFKSSNRMGPVFALHRDELQQ